MTRAPNPYDDPIPESELLRSRVDRGLRRLYVIVAMVVLVNSAILVLTR